MFCLSSLHSNGTKWNEWNYNVDDDDNVDDDVDEKHDMFWKNHMVVFKNQLHVFFQSSVSFSCSIVGLSGALNGQRRGRVPYLCPGK